MAMDFARSIILDTETLGLQRGAGIHSVGIYSFSENRAREYHLSPNAVHIDTAVHQDWTKLAGNWKDTHTLSEPGSWGELVNKARTGEGAQFFKEHLPRYTWLTGNYTDAQTHARQKALGMPLSTFSTTPQQLLRPGGTLERELKGKTVWIANTQFENKQIGALMGGLASAGHPVTALKSSMQTFSGSTDPFYVTGVQTQTARMLAQRDNDWTRVWKAMKSEQPAVGETAVRDIQDVIRAVMSYGHKTGLLKGTDVGYGTSIDVVYKLMGGLDSETHLAAEDAARHERLVLTRGAEWAEALQQVHEGTELGQHYVRQAQAGTGTLFDINAYFQKLKSVAPQLRRQTLMQRFQRAQQDIEQHGATVVTQGWGDIYTRPQNTPDGGVVDIPENQAARVRMSSMDQVVDYLARDASYLEHGIDARHEYNELVKTAGGQGASSAEITSALESLKKGFSIPSSAMDLKSAVAPDFGKLLTKSSTGWHGKAALGLAAFVGVGVWWGTEHGRDTYDSTNYLGYGYEDFLKHQDQFSGTAPYSMNMQESGIAGAKRRMNTDFGSPYQGIMASQSVFEDQQLLREREKYVRSEFTRQINDPEFGLFGIDSPFKGMGGSGRGGYNFIEGGQPTNSRKLGLRGNLLEIDLSSGDWKASAEDADTVVVRRGGIRGAISSFFGFNKGFSFRLAGIDSPETSHGEGSYHAPQPGAEQSKAVLQEIMRKGDLKLYYDPKQTTYGRAMGVVFQDGKNVNYQLVQQGAAAYLPFGKADKSMISYDKLKIMEQMASDAGRGMWSQPWGQTYRSIMEAGGNDRITLNTFTKADKLVRSQSVTSTLGLMEQAQLQGGLTPQQREESVLLGQSVALRDTKGDYNDRFHFSRRNEPTQVIAAQVTRDLQGFMETKGGQSPQNQFSRRSGYGKLDNALALDTLHTTNNVWQHPSMEAATIYGSRDMIRQDRKQRQAALQRSLNQTVFASGINHQQM